MEYELTVCKVRSIKDINTEDDFFFAAKTDEEISLVCKTENVPQQTIQREDGWRCFRVEGTLDFSLVGILSKLSAILAENGISIFAVSTFNTDYVLVKKESFEFEKPLYNDVSSAPTKMDAVDGLTFYECKCQEVVNGEHELLRKSYYTKKSSKLLSNIQ